MNILGNPQAVAPHWNASCPHCCRKTFPTHTAISVNVVDCHAILNVPWNQFFHNFIDTACSQTAAERQNAHAIIKAQFFPCLFFCLLQDACSYWQPCNGIWTVEIHIFQCFLYRQHHMVNFLGQHLIGDTWECILFMNRTRHTHLCSHPNHWSCNIAACTNRNIWLKFVDNLLGTFAGCGKIPRSLCISADIFHRQLSLKSSNFNGCELIPRLWY